MRIKIKITENNLKHTRFIIFVNGANCGNLCMNSVDAFVFFNMLQYGAEPANVNMEYENDKGKLFSDGKTPNGYINAEDAEVHRGGCPNDEGELRPERPLVRATEEPCKGADVGSEDLLTEKAKEFLSRYM